MEHAGIGSTLGLGVYVLAGEVAGKTAGPSVCLSFTVALCYAEFGSRVPRAGSAYLYSYVTVGEFMAFVIGWNLVLEYIIVLLAFGVKESIRLHTIMTVVNLSVVVFVIVAGLIKANLHNWQISKNEIPAQYTWAGNGGFFPNGFSGMMAGAATCFYAFVGFDAIAATGEEAKNPKRNIPLSICFSLLIIYLAYFGISAVQTLMYPYYLQHKDLTNGAALPYVFDKVGWHWAKWVVSIGALNGLSTSLLGAMYPLPRVLYAMGSDGVIFRIMASVNARFKTPIWATMISGLFAACMAAIFDLDQLADMMSIGTLLAYTLVAESIIIIRYSDDMNDINQLVFLQNDIFDGKVVPIVTSSFTLALICIVISLLIRQPMIQKSRSFEVPGVPIVPLLSVFVNVYLMFNLSVETWIRFLVWMIIGFLIYGLYGIRNSNERQNRSNNHIKAVSCDGQSSKL
ncbi:unnamed protein product [Medioppia subpectinata]|uniref:Cationic amino acid transporter C-terminal domain-containing protein n=1 Tax=Medioppia subpectinata TaxID=1979941 RepID=A0A7R9KSI3_9ACAR|nr:unnamed protein product [Medioppia subpectinata]CAG2108917.1 unnamed protein product [Medioppia subpectinata]